MKIKTLAVVVFVFAATGAWAQDKSAVKDTKKYLEQLQLKLEHTARRANQPTATGSSVVGLRGTKQEPMSKQLYWKGKQGPAPVTPEEVRSFRSAIEQAQAGQIAEAISALKAFQEKYPNSSLAGEARESIDMLSAPTTSTSPAATSGPVLEG